MGSVEEQERDLREGKIGRASVVEYVNEYMNVLDVVAQAPQN